MLLELNRTESKSIFNAQINAEEIRVGYFANLHCMCLGVKSIERANVYREKKIDFSVHGSKFVNF